MWKAIGLSIGLAVLPLAAAAEESVRFGIGHDVYLAGNAPRFSGDGATEDLFMAGQKVTVDTAVKGAAHLAGRRIEVNGAVGGDLFAMGYSVDVAAPVAGDASLAGFEVVLAQGAGGNLRAGASDLTVNGTIGGYALLSAAALELNGTVTGDAVLAADSLTFGPEAKVGGALTVYASDPAGVTVPDSVAPAARVRVIQRTAANAPNVSDFAPVKVSPWLMIRSFLTGILFTGIVALIMIALAPKQVQLWRDVAQAHPGRAILSGFLAASALVGSGIVLALTLVGALLIPVVAVAVAVAIFAGYALGSYVLGSALWLGFGRAMPQELPGKFGLAVLGAAVVALAWFVPVLGWLFAMAVTLMGIGTLAALVLPGNLMLNRGHVAAVSGN